MISNKFEFTTIQERDREVLTRKMNKLLNEGWIVLASSINPVPGTVESELSFIYVFCLQRLFQINPSSSEEEE